MRIDIKYNRNLFYLNEDEITEFNRKLKIYNDFMELFGKHVNVNNTIFRPFKIKEMLSHSNISSLKSLSSRRGYSVYNLVCFSSIIDEIKDTYTVEEYYDVILRILDISNEVMENNSSLVSDFENIISFAIKNIVGENLDEFFIKLCDAGVISNPYKQSEAVDTLVSTILRSSNIKDVDKFLSYVNTYLPNFRNYPLIILNSNVEKDKRIKILKSKYKQKDLPSYISIIKENINNLDVIDDFIEATVLQNNRVKEKEFGIVSIFKYIFITTDSYWSRGRKNVDYKSMEGIDNFSIKYSEYFKNKSFVKMVADHAVNLSTNQYYRSYNFRDFLANIILHSCSTEDSIKIISTVSTCMDSEEITANFIDNLLKDNKINEVKQVLTAIINDCRSKDSSKWDYIYNLGCYKRIKDVKELNDFLQSNYFINVRLYDGKTGIISEGLASDVFTFDPEIDSRTYFLCRNILGDKELVLGGLVYDELAGLKIRYFDPGYCVDVYKRYLENIVTHILPNITDDECLLIYTSLLLKFEVNDDYMAEFAGNAIDFENTSNDHLKNTYRYSYGGKNIRKTSTALIENFELVYEIFKKVSPILVSKYPNVLSEVAAQELNEKFDMSLSNAKLLLAL